MVLMSENKTIAEAYESNAPTLTYMDLCYGKGSAIVWLVGWISNIYSSCGFVNGQVTDTMKVSAATAIMQEYYYLNLNELVVFFKMFVAGKFNTFYGNPNPQVITSSLNLFLTNRNDVVARIEKKKQVEKELAEAQCSAPMTYEEWKASKDAKGEEVNLELIEDAKGNKMFKTKPPKKDERLDSAYMIVKNTANVDFNTLCNLRETFIKKYDIDPYELIKKLGNKKLKEYEKERNR